MNGNLGVWDQARPKIPSLPARRELVREWGPWSVRKTARPQKKVTLGVQGMGPLSSASSFFYARRVPTSLSAAYPFAVLSTPSFLGSMDLFVFSALAWIPKMRNCRSDHPSGISIKVQMGEFSQTIVSQTIRPIIELSLGMLGKLPSVVRRP